MMHLHTHFLSGWCTAHLVSLSPKERFFCLLASIAPDLDGLGILIDRACYLQYHHVLAHNFCFAFLFSLLLTWFSQKTLKTFWIYFACIHFHFLLDSFGSGLGWTLYYFWPFSSWELKNPWEWGFDSWQNGVAVLLFFAWTVVLFHQKKRTPFEYLWPFLNQKMVRYLERVEENTKKS